MKLRRLLLVDQRSTVDLILGQRVHDEHGRPWVWMGSHWLTRLLIEILWNAAFNSTHDC